MKPLSVFTTIISLILIFNLSRQIYRLSTADDRINQTQEKLNKLKLENWKLLEEKNRRQTNDYLESEISDELVMSKQGEPVIVIPKEDSPKVATADGEVNIQVSLPVWRLWLEVFR
jgi:cell division protein FtsB